MNSIRSTSIFVFLALPPLAFAQTADHRLGEHPAVIVKRLSEHQDYDYASKFYPHPAWLYLGAEAPRSETDHSVVTLAQPQRGVSPASSPALSASRIDSLTSRAEPHVAHD
ncbi:MAG TPA: hypothetical protein VMG60_07425 [Burkholderiaceae bacterium]|nr:hypothetical protein [Burkholderiaceae bacterium]